MNNRIYIICEKIFDDYLKSKLVDKDIVRIENEFNFDNIESVIYDIDYIYIQDSISYDVNLLNKLLEINPQVYYLRLPGIFELIGSKMFEKIENLSYENCFDKKPTEILDDYKSNNLIKDKVVLVAGAAGSIGSEIVKEVVKLSPKKIILLDNNENRLYFLELYLKSNFIDNIEVVSGNIQDIKRMDHIFDMFRPSVLFHAAASKHVPLSEMNPAETIKNNVIGTYNLFTLADKYQVERAVLISTDKAVNPTNVMGATKRLAELVIHNINYKYTKVSAVRFGNVFGSQGSLLEIFQEQLRNGKNLTVTDRNVTRYFMSITEAAQLVIVASLLQEKNSLFVLDMGDPVVIYDLAKKIIKLVGSDVDIDVVGLRPGEKLYEELIYDNANVERTSNNKIYISKNEYNIEFDASELILKYKNIIEQNHRRRCIEELKKDVPTFKHNRNY